MTPTRQAAYSALSLVIVLLWFQLIPTDMWIQKLLFNTSSDTWLLDKTDPVLRFLFYDGIKILLVIFWLGLSFSLLFFRQSLLINKYRQGLRIVLLSLIVVPSVVAATKATTNIACPRDIDTFGGDITYVYVFDIYPANKRPNQQQKCFPAGHASGGFALMSLYFLFNSAPSRRRALFSSITAGWLMGGYKMIIGDHFFSHTVVTMLLAWLIINLIVMIDRHLPHYSVTSNPPLKDNSHLPSLTS